MLSVMIPVNVFLLGGAARAATAARVKTTNARATERLRARNHDVRGARTGIHDPRAALARFIGYSERLLGCSRHSNGGVVTGVLLVSAHQVDERRSELRL